MLALVFPGQGSQEVGMGSDVYHESAAARAVFDAADHALGFELSRLCFEGPEDDLHGVLGPGVREAAELQGGPPTKFPLSELASPFEC